ncbi:SMP-30/gluconolactonase/LRE family protein [Nocardia cyriacigeorgica]|uniref:SMP-30/gluconolactonase/LRE family protein n=1 Tax=Nocardia cyriacigeorgica TaxID=135487 RepID=UPI00245813FB|nr:SMP-30/gluconolactonase/LRE family protein [Nocardia cyriacigeorgica]
MKEHALQIVSSGHRFLEAPRWHDGQLWASDFFTKRVLKFDADGTFHCVAEIEGTPSGLGFLADGSVLVVSQDDTKLLRIDPSGAVAEYADFGSVATGRGNDLLVTPSGHAYAGNFGFAYGQEEPKAAALAHIDPAGVVTQTESSLEFPNGTALAADGTLLVAETLGSRITAFDVKDDGSLANQRVWAQLPESYHPDGIAIDSDNGVWFGNAMTTGQDAGFYRVTEGGAITDKIPVTDAWGVACAFGGPDLTTLYLTVNATDIDSFHRGESSGYIAIAEVGRSGVAAKELP